MTRAAQPKTGTAVSVRGVTRVFRGGVRAIESLSLEVPVGQFLAILGPSGSGKSTLLRIIAGLDRADAGEVSVRGAGPAAFVFQDAHLLPWRNVLRNVALPLELQRVPKARRLEAARHAIGQVGLADFATKYPAQLSGGMKMRVSLARALVTEPTLLLLDEPFAALDEITRQRLDEQLRELWARRGMTVIFVTHSIPEATYLAERAVVVTRRPARIVIDHPIALGSDRVASLRGEPSFARETRVLYDALERGERA
jgi:NitT/TauT family transport system ATP-binding protein